MKFPPHDDAEIVNASNEVARALIDRLGPTWSPKVPFGMLVQAAAILADYMGPEEFLECCRDAFELSKMTDSQKYFDPMEN